MLCKRERNALCAMFHQSEPDVVRGLQIFGELLLPNLALMRLVKGSGGKVGVILKLQRIAGYISYRKPFSSECASHRFVLPEQAINGLWHHTAF